MTERTIVVTELDYDRLGQLLSGYGKGINGKECDALEAELERAEILPPAAIPPNVVTMRSRVRFRDESSGDEMEATLVYPSEANWQEGRISVLAPVGAALLGLATDETIDWPVPGGTSRRLRVIEVLYQPEAAGHFDR